MHSIHTPQFICLFRINIAQQTSLASDLYGLTIDQRMESKNVVTHRSHYDRRPNSMRPIERLNWRALLRKQKINRSSGTENTSNYVYIGIGIPTRTTMTMLSYRNYRHKNYRPKTTIPRDLHSSTNSISELLFPSSTCPTSVTSSLNLDTINISLLRKEILLPTLVHSISSNSRHLWRANHLLYCIFIHSFIPDISIAPLQVHYTTQRRPRLQHCWPTVSELTLRNATDNCKWRTCRRYLRVG